jgi:ubiquinone/menaquinone biosynthesis C-methylase UbiE
MAMTEAEQAWEDHYGERDRVWSGHVNVRLAEVAGSLTPGRALDLGCGEGGDAMWLAEHGRQSTPKHETCLAASISSSTI